MKVVNFSSHGFAPSGFSGIEKAVASAGIIFAYLGFQQAVGFSGEAKNPQRNVPLAILLAVLGAAALYVLLQVCFVGALPADALKNGWSGVQFTSPFANVAAAIGLGWLSNLILADAVISPSGTANIYLSATARVIFAWAKTGTFFKVFTKVDAKSGVPRPALWLSLIVSIIFTLPFPSWGELVGVVSSATVLTYILGPISAHAFRRTAPNMDRPFRLAGMGIISPISFIVASLIIYWSGWATDKLLIGMQLVMWVLYVLFNKFVPKQKVSLAQQLKSTWWLVVYYALMMVFSYLGDPSFGGNGTIAGPWDQIIVIVMSLITYNWGIRSAIPNPDFSEDDDEEVAPRAVAKGQTTTM
jgi:amino acid transporter